MYPFTFGDFLYQVEALPVQLKRILIRCGFDCNDLFSYVL